jgi:5-methylthioribose kinase
VKQALPYVRLVGEGWPMTLARTFFEQRYMREQQPHVGRYLPELYHYEPALYAIVMELLTPHIIMRRGMIRGVRYPAFAAQIADYLANSLYFTSDLGLPAAQKKQLMAVFAANTELCKITEDLIFTEPYRIGARNRWTTPQLDDIAAEFREDAALKLAVSRLKLRFLSSAEALIHGDLHTGSVMITESELRVIDAEFSFVGPMGFDIGAVIGNLLLSYFSQEGHATAADPRGDYEAWILEAIERVWNEFSERFLALWRQQKGAGDAYPAALFVDEAGQRALEAERGEVMLGIYEDTLGFAAAKKIRRILGLAHVIDLEQIADPDRRALCEKRALRMARELMVQAERYPSIADVTRAAHDWRRRSAATL